jgi:hypothetical protein
MTDSMIAHLTSTNNYMGKGRVCIFLIFAFLSAFFCLFSCGGGGGSTIQNSSIQDAGDHTHASGCTPVDNDEGLGAWSDGITFAGPGHVIVGNTIANASDVGIVFSGYPESPSQMTVA